MMTYFVQQRQRRRHIAVTQNIVTRRFTFNLSAVNTTPYASSYFCTYHTNTNQYNQKLFPSASTYGCDEVQIRRRFNFKLFHQIQNLINVLTALLSNASSRKNPCSTTDFVCTESQRVQTNLFFFLKFNLSNYSNI